MYGSIKSDATEAAPTRGRRTRGLLAVVVAAAALAGAAAAVTVLGLRASSAELVQEEAGGRLDDAAGGETPSPTSMPRCDGDRTPVEGGYPAPGPYVVTWHVWDHAEGMGFASRAEAETCFKEYEENVKKYAVRLYDANLEVLEQHGCRGCDFWDDLRAWAEDFMGITAGPTATLSPTAVAEEAVP